MTETDAFAESHHAIRDAILSSFGVPRHVLLGESPPMTPEQAFTQAIIETPDDDTPRLVFADYLEEHGDEEQAEFIRVQIELAKYKSNRCPNRQDRKSPQTLLGYPVIIKGENCGRCRWCQLDRREKELLPQQRTPFRYRQTLYVNESETRFRWSDSPDMDNPVDLVFRRGFIAEITLSCADWLAHRERLLKAVPLEEVTLTHVPHLSPQDTVCLRRGQSLYLNNEVGDVVDLSFPASNLTTPSR